MQQTQGILQFLAHSRAIADQQAAQQAAAKQKLTQPGEGQGRSERTRRLRGKQTVQASFSSHCPAVPVEGFAASLPSPAQMPSEFDAEPKPAPQSPETSSTQTSPPTAPRIRRLRPLAMETHHDEEDDREQHMHGTDTIRSVPQPHLVGKDAGSNEAQKLLVHEQGQKEGSSIEDQFRELQEYGRLERELLQREKQRKALEKQKRAEPQQKVEKDARVKAGVEAKQKAKAEEEAKQRAREEARVNVEKEAKQKAKEEARVKAKEEARLRAEAEARLKAEKETKQKTEEEEARVKAEKESAAFVPVAIPVEVAAGVAPDVGQADLADEADEVEDDEEEMQRKQDKALEWFQEMQRKQDKALEWFTEQVELDDSPRDSKIIRTTSGVLTIPSKRGRTRSRSSSCSSSSSSSSTSSSSSSSSTTSSSRVPSRAHKRQRTAHHAVADELMGRPSDATSPLREKLLQELIQDREVAVQAKRNGATRQQWAPAAASLSASSSSSYATIDLTDATCSAMSGQEEQAARSTGLGSDESAPISRWQPMTHKRKLDFAKESANEREVHAMLQQLERLGELLEG